MILYSEKLNYCILYSVLINFLSCRIRKSPYARLKIYQNTNHTTCRTCNIIKENIKARYFYNCISTKIVWWILPYRQVVPELVYYNLILYYLRKRMIIMRVSRALYTHYHPKQYNWGLAARNLGMVRGKGITDLCFYL